MTPIIVATVMSVVEIIVLWTGWKSTITQEWVETTLMILTPIFVGAASIWPSWRSSRSQ